MPDLILSNSYRFLLKPFAQLSVAELYAIMRLRSEVFVVEQNCVYLDPDNKDQQCHHLMLWKDDVLTAYARLVPPGISFEEISIGRIISSPKYRSTGAGKFLVAKAIEYCREIFGEGPIKIGAQLYLKKFYESFGFIACSEVYDEDGIDHIEMIRK